MKTYRRILFALLSFFSLQVCGQSNYVLDNIFNLNLKFKMHQDSLTGLARIQCPVKILDSTFVDTGDRLLNLTKVGIYTSECLHPTHIETFLSQKLSSDSVLVFLNFYAKRLISFSVYFTSDSIMADVDSRIIKHFGTYQRKLNDKKFSVRVRKKKDPIFYTFWAADTQAMKYMPSFCGNCNRKYRRTKTWENLEKYVLRE